MYNDSEWIKDVANNPVRNMAGLHSMIHMSCCSKCFLGYK